MVRWGLRRSAAGAFVAGVAAWGAALGLSAAEPARGEGVAQGNGQSKTPPAEVAAFTEKHCAACHDADNPEAGLNLTRSGFGLEDGAIQALWVKVHDRVAAGEMPPAGEPRPPKKEVAAFLAGLARPLIAADAAREVAEGRAVRRRLNRYEYENTLRDLLGAPWLQVRRMLPEDGEAARFNKVGSALDVSHVQMAQYLAAADYAFRETLAASPKMPAAKRVRHYARDQGVIARKMIFTEFNRSPERATFPVLDYEGQPDVRSAKLPLTRGAADPALREREAMGTVASSYEPIELKFDRFKAPHSGLYRLRLNAYAVWVGPGKEPAKNPRWWRPDLDTVSKGRRSEPVTLSAEAVPRQLRRLTTVDVGIEPTEVEFEAYLLEGETIRVDAARLFRSRPPGTTWRNPLATPEGQPGVAFKWLEVEGPIFKEWPTAGHRLLYGDLPLRPTGRADRPYEPAPRSDADAEGLLRNFVARAYRRPVEEAEIARFLAVIRGALRDGNGFTDSLNAGYAAVLCSPGFVSVEETPGPLDDRALAARLSYFLWNSEPDAELRRLAAAGELRQGKTLAAQTERLLADPRAERFVEAFLDYWLDLRHIDGTSPDAELYGDYYLDDLLVESAVRETREFFTLMVRENLPAKSVASTDFVLVDERLANHYGLPGVEGSALRKVKLPADSPRGGLFTQAAVLKVTANGTTTSPVVRGAWFMERILGQRPPPPPPGIPAVEPDIRGAKTIREQLAKHRSQTSCAACHAKIDPAGFALEQFDVLGGFRTRYRAVGEADGTAEAGLPVPGHGKNGQPFAFRQAQPIDASGNLPDGRKFADVRELKRLLSADDRTLARNLVVQLTTYATTAPVRFGDRARIEAILDRAAPSKYGVRTLIREIVQSPLFLMK